MGEKLLKSKTVGKLRFGVYKMAKLTLKKKTKPLSLGEKKTKPLSLGEKKTKPLSLGEKKTKPLSLREKKTKPLSLGEKKTKPLSLGGKKTRHLSLKGKKATNALSLAAKKLALKKKEQEKKKEQAKKKKLAAAKKLAEKAKKPVVEVESRASKQNRLKKELSVFPVWCNKQPFEVGILADFLKRFYPTFSKKIIRLVITKHTSGAEYLKNVVDGDKRFNLDGEITGEITEKEKIYSRRKLKALIQKVSETSEAEA